MGLKNCDFKMVGNGDFAVRLARHLWRGRTTRGQAAGLAAEYYSVPKDPVFEEMTKKEYDLRGMPTGLRTKRFDD